MDDDASRHATLADLGWDPGWAAAFLPFDAAGLAARPGSWPRTATRWVLAHRRPATATPSSPGRLRHEALGPGDLPAVGDWVAVGAAPGRRRRPATVIQAVLPRRTAFRRSAGRSGTRHRRAGPGRQRGRRVRGGGPGRRLQPAPPRALPRGRLERAARRPSSCSTRPTSPTDLDGLRVGRRGVAPGTSRSAPISALTGDGVADLAARHLAPGPDRGRARLVGRRQVHPRQRAPRARAPAHARGPRGRLPRPPHDHAPGARPPARRRAPDRHPGHPLAWASRGRPEGLGPRVRRHRRTSPRMPVRATAATSGSRAARSAPRSPTGG